MLCHLFKLFHWKRIGWCAFIGVILLAINVPFGYGGAAICSALAAAHPEQKSFWIAAAAGVYAFSWVMLLGGSAMAGPPVARAFKRRLPLTWRAWRRRRKRVVH